MSLYSILQERYDHISIIILTDAQIFVANKSKYYVLSFQTLVEIRQRKREIEGFCLIDSKYAKCSYDSYGTLCTIPYEIKRNELITHIFPVSDLKNSIDSRILLDKAWDTPRISGKLLEFPWKDVEIRYLK